MYVFIVMLKLTAIMVLAALLLYTTYMYVKRHRRVIITEYKIQPYGCGEALTREQVSVTSKSLFWSIVYKVFKSMYAVLRDRIHTGVLSDWFILMILFMAIALIVLTLIALVFAIG